MTRKVLAFLALLGASLAGAHAFADPAPAVPGAPVPTPLFMGCDGQGDC